MGISLTIEQFYSELKQFMEENQTPYKLLDDGLDFSKSDVDILLKCEDDLKKIKAYIKTCKIKTLIKINKKKQFYFIVSDAKKIHAFDFMVGLLSTSGEICNGNYFFQSSEGGVNFIENYKFLKNSAKNKGNFYVVKEVSPGFLLNASVFLKKLTRNINNLFKKPTGLSVVLLGADGSGKSTALNYIKEQFSEKRKLFPLKRIYFKPTVFKIKPDNKNSLQKGHIPHNASSYPSILSLAKVLYVFLNYILYLPMLYVRKKNGHLILFDRHFYDLIIDSKRHRINEKGVYWAKFLTKFLPKPDVLIILSCEPEQLSKRKPGEVPIELLHQLNNAYQAFKPSKVNTYQIINNNSVEYLHEQLSAILITNIIK
ncbi:thymidylate kinase [Legionella sp. km772]|uniref:thymidylate kinase n=1 Tax=Legionella sp. km772 TaxID=2498111 RepID=UPI000F8F34E3|nr:thymidylate kinase [Legionella sp. km772]RUR12738.1 thymidylate kinase [Legionella sp. km772]